MLRLWISTTSRSSNMFVTSSSGFVPSCTIAALIQPRSSRPRRGEKEPRRDRGACRRKVPSRSIPFFCFKLIPNLVLSGRARKLLTWRRLGRAGSPGVVRPPAHGSPGPLRSETSARGAFMEKGRLLEPKLSLAPCSAAIPVARLQRRAIPLAALHTPWCVLAHADTGRRRPGDTRRCLRARCRRYGAWV